MRGPGTPRLGIQALAGLCSHLEAPLGKNPLLSSFRLLAEFSSLQLQVEAPAFSRAVCQEQLPVLEVDHILCHVVPSSIYGIPLMFPRSDLYL